MQIDFRTCLNVIGLLGSTFFAIDALRKGKAEVPVRNVDIVYDRTDDPVRYWVTVGALVLFVVLFAILLFDPGVYGPM